MPSKQAFKKWYSENKEVFDLILVVGTIIIAVGTVILIIPPIKDFFDKTQTANSGFIKALSILGTTVGLPLYIILLVVLGIIIAYKKLKKKYSKATTIEKNSLRSKQMQITAYCSQSGKANLTYPLKLYFHIRNNARCPVAVDNVIFEVGSGIIDDPKGHRKRGSNIYKPDLLLKEVNNTELWFDQAVIPPTEKVTLYIPIQPSFGKEAVEKALKNKTAGKLSFRYTFLDEDIVTDNYEESF